MSATEEPGHSAREEPGQLSRADVIHVANLARLSLSEDEVDTFTAQLRTVLAHAAACRAHGVAATEAGIMLWGWFMPLAYVDCTHVYRLAQRRPRIIVALAGPYVDLVAAGGCAAVALASGGELAGSADLALLLLSGCRRCGPRPAISCRCCPRMGISRSRPRAASSIFAAAHGWHLPRPGGARGSGLRAVSAAYTSATRCFAWSTRHSCLARWRRRWGTCSVRLCRRRARSL